MLDRSTASYYTPIYQPNGKYSGQPANPDQTWSNTIPLNKTTVYGGSLTFKYDLDDNLSLKSVTAVRGMHGPIYYDNDGVTQIKGDSYAGFNQNYETQEFTINGDYDKLNFVGGLFYFNEYFHNDRLSQSAGSPMDNVGVQTHANSYLKTQSYAAFANADYKITPALTATGGLRYTLDHRGFENHGHQQSNSPLIYPLPGNNDPALFDTIFGPNATVFNSLATPKNYSALTPKAGLSYQLTKDILSYATYSRGFKSGGYDLRATSENASLTPYRPQYTNAYELGWKSAFFDHRITANIAAFYNQLTDIQVRASSNGALGTPVNSLINAGDAHTYGGELELNTNPARGFTFGGSLAFLKTQYDTFTATLPPNVAGRTTLVGLDFPLSPTWQGNINGNYKLPLTHAGHLANRCGCSNPDPLLHGHLQHVANGGGDAGIPERHVQLHVGRRELVGRRIREQRVQYSPPAIGRILANQLRRGPIVVRRLQSTTLHQLLRQSRKNLRSVASSALG